MSTRDTRWEQGTPCWAELTVPSTKKAMAFYGPLLGWTFEDLGEEAGHYTMATMDGRRAAGVGEPMPGQEAPPPAWTTYLATDDVEETTGRVGAAGGRVLVGPMDVMDVGRMAIAADPTGAVFGLWQGITNIGAGVVNQPGAMTWNECMTRDPQTARDFYAAAFGAENERVPGDFDYTMLKVAGRPVGGVGQLPDNLPAEIPAHWMTYFEVADVDAAVAQVARLGGRVEMGPKDMAYGRFAVVTDDQGATFSLITSSQPG